VSDAPRPAHGLHLDVIGAGPAYSDREGATGAAYLVRSGETAVCLDLGHGAFSRLARTIEPSRLGAVLVSHLHPDHFIDLVALRHYLRWEFKPSRRVRVIGPRSLDARLDALHADPGFSAHALDVEALRAGTIAIGTLRVEAARIRHTKDSYGFRVAAGEGIDGGTGADEGGTGADDGGDQARGVAGGPGLVYSGDCGRAEDLDPLIRPGDTLLSEVSFGPGPVVPGAEHLDGPAVGRLAARTGAARVLLTHLQMGYDPRATIDSVRAHFEGPVQLVTPGDAFAIT
jgi:ribonuclease BN (tRNA processing enzyme)